MDPFSNAEVTRDQESESLSSTEASLDVDEVGPRFRVERAASFVTVFLWLEP